MAGFTAEGVLPVLPSILSDALMIGLAVWLLALDVNSRTHRAFAAVLVFRAATSDLGVLRRVLGAEATPWLQAMFGYFLIPVAALLLYFACVYPRRRFLGAWRHGGWIVLATVIFLELAYIFDHALLATWEPATPTTPSFSLAAGGLAYTAYGPLQLAAAALFPSFAAVALVLALEYRAEERPTRSLFLIMAAFLLNSLFDGTLRLLELAELVNSGQAFPWWPWGWARALLPALTLPIALAALWVLAGVRHPGPKTRLPPERVLLLWACLPVASAFLVGGADVAEAGWARDGQSLVRGAWRFVLPLVVTFALLRYRLFNIELRTRALLADGAVVGSFGVAFFTITQLATDLAGRTWGSVVGFSASGLVALAGKPIQQFAWRVTGRLMPKAKQVGDMKREERKAFYQERYDLLMEDGALSIKEHAMLASLAARLGLAPAELAGLKTSP